MKQILSILAVLTITILGSSCNMNPVAPNHEGVLMTNYGRNGKSDFQAVTGSQGVLGMGTELYQVPMYEQTADPQRIEITSFDGGKFTVDPSYTYEAIRGKGVDIIFSYKHVGMGEGMMDNIEKVILDRLVTNVYRDEARNYSTDSLLRNMKNFEIQCETQITKVFEGKFFKLNNLTSGLLPPPSMTAMIEARNNRVIEAEKVKNELEISRMNLEKAKIDAEKDKIQSTGLTKEILQQQWIEAIRYTKNKVIITDGRTPIMLGN
jgi:hypothetical protein